MHGFKVNLICPPQRWHIHIVTHLNFLVINILALLEHTLILLVFFNPVIKFLRVFMIKTTTAAPICFWLMQPLKKSLSVIK